MQHYTIGPDTNRLEHRAFSVDDAEAFFALNSNPDVMRLTGEPVLPSVDAARQAIANYADFDAVGYAWIPFAGNTCQFFLQPTNSERRQSVQQPIGGDSDSLSG